jgi:hypothetical protein
MVGDDQRLDRLARIGVGVRSCVRARLNVARQSYRQRASFVEFHPLEGPKAEDSHDICFSHGVGETEPSSEGGPNLRLCVRHIVGQSTTSRCI